MCAARQVSEREKLTFKVFGGSNWYCKRIYAEEESNSEGRFVYVFDLMIYTIIEIVKVGGMHGFSASHFTFL